MKYKKSLGQHFLKDEEVCKEIVNSLAGELSEMQVLEIGPGAGAITKYLLQKPFRDFKIVELDREKVALLSKAFPKSAPLLIEADFLHIQKPFEGEFVIIGNFPYNISSQILFKVLDWEPDVQQLVGMFQKEVAERVASLHGNKSYGILSVLIQAFYKVEYLFTVGPEKFVPPPKVQSGVIRLLNNENLYNVNDKKSFKTMVKIAFSQRRKTLRNCFKAYYDEGVLAGDLFAKRAEQLSVQDFVDLHTYLNEHK